MPKIRVHEKALAHLTRGLYRSPASALRELVSNAWDANATVVRVDTNYPNFLQLSVEDNGDGFTKMEFDRVMGGGIGNSEKRDKDNPREVRFGRQTIGRLGIGMLGIAQIALGFTITSKTASGEGFRARVRLYDLLKPKLDDDDAEVVRAEDEIDIGVYEFDDDFDPTDAKRGTSIITNDLHPQFTQAFQQSVKAPPPSDKPASKARGAVKEPKFVELPMDWAGAVKILSQNDSLQLLGDYWRLLWELAASTPVRYLDAGVIPRGMVKEEQGRLEGYNFKLYVDGIELRKPIDLRADDSPYITQPISMDRRVYGNDVKLHGYIAVRDGKQIRPDELRGLMIRIKNIGIGYYDQTLLDFRVNQGPRSRWLTGEIFMDAGLEDALNVDRDSFNRFHPHFRAVQAYIHGVLKKDIFPTVYRHMDERSTDRSKQKDDDRVRHVKDVVNAATSKAVTLRTAKGSEDDGDLPRAHVEETSKGVQVTIPRADDVPTRKPYRQTAAAILGIFEVAMKEPTTEKRREMFARLLINLFQGW